MSTTFETAALWSATPLANDPDRIGAAGLSIRQRKLLTLLSQPMSVAQLANSIALPIDEVHNALDRFAKLGFARSGEPVSIPFNPMQLRALSSVAVAPTTSPSRTPMMIGVAVAAFALIAAVAWTFRGSSGSSTTPALSVSNATMPAPLAPALTGEADSINTAITVSPRSAAAPKPTAVAPAVLPAAATKLPAASAPNAAAVTVAAKVAGAPTTAALAPATTPTPSGVVVTPAAAPTAITAAPLSTPVTTSNPAGATVATAAALTTATAPVAAPAVVAPAPGTAIAAAAPASPALATATPTRTTPVAARPIKLITRVEPQFPRGFENDTGTVRARLQVDARGSVTGVDIVEANPPRVFDRNVRAALQQWRYEPTGEAFSTMAEVIFRR